MSQIDTYYAETIQFVNSLCIKIDEIRIHQNYHTYVKHGLAAPTVANSKYYQNITGSKKETIDLYYGDTLITRESLNNNIQIKGLLGTYGDEFNTLCFKYAGLSDYIRGCLLDITIDEIIELDNYKVIDYNKTFVGENEIGLIAEIEAFVSIYMKNYNNRRYMIDELYLANVLGILSHQLVLFIITKRSEKRQSVEVDLFHMSSKLLSYKNTYTYSKPFNLSTNIWLYGNLDRLKRNVGKNITINEVLNNLFNINNVGIAKLHLRSNLPTLIDENILDITKEYYERNSSYINAPANSSCYNIKDDIYSVAEVNRILYNNNYSVSLEDDLNTIENKLNKESDTQLTDLYILDKTERINVHNSNIFVYSVSNILSLIEDNRVEFTVDFYSNNTKKLYTLSMTDIKNIIISLLYKIYKLDVTTFTLSCSGIINSEASETELLSKTWYKDKIRNIFDYILNNVNRNANLYNLDVLHDYLSSIRTMDSRSWFLISNITDVTAKTDIKNFMTGLLITKEFDYNIDNINTYLEDNDLIGIVNDNYKDTINSLLLSTTGLDTDITKSIVSNMTKYQNLFDNFTSYTIDLAIDNDFIDKLVVKNSSQGLLGNYKSFLQVETIQYNLYANLDIALSGTGFLDKNVLVDYSTTIDHFIMPGSKSLPCLYRSDIINEIDLHATTKDLYGKEYKMSIDNVFIPYTSSTYLQDEHLTTIKTVIDGVPILHDSNNTDNIFTEVIYSEYHGERYKFTGANIYGIPEHTNVVSILPPVMKTDIIGEDTIPMFNDIEAPLTLTTSKEFITNKRYKTMLDNIDLSDNTNNVVTDEFKSISNPIHEGIPIELVNNTIDVNTTVSASGLYKGTTYIFNAVGIVGFDNGISNSIPNDPLILQSKIVNATINSEDVTNEISVTAIPPEQLTTNNSYTHELLDINLDIDVMNTSNTDEISVNPNIPSEPTVIISDEEDIENIITIDVFPV